MAHKFIFSLAANRTEPVKWGKRLRCVDGGTTLTAYYSDHGTFMLLHTIGDDGDECVFNVITLAQLACLFPASGFEPQRTLNGGTLNSQLMG